MSRRDPQASYERHRRLYGTVNAAGWVSERIKARAAQLGVTKNAMATAVVEAALDAAGAPPVRRP